MNKMEPENCWFPKKEFRFPSRVNIQDLYSKIPRGLCLSYFGWDMLARAEDRKFLQAKEKFEEVGEMGQLEVQHGLGRWIR